MNYFLIFLGGGIGASLRHFVNVCFASVSGASFPFHTLFENVTGSFLTGLVAGYFAFLGDASGNTRLFITTGILGGYTTFSAFSLDTVLLWERGQTGLAAGYVLLSVVGSLGGLVLGMIVIRELTHFFSS